MTVRPRFLLRFSILNRQNVQMLHCVPGDRALPWACDLCSSLTKIQAVKLTGWKAPLWLAALLPEPLMLSESPDRSEFNTDPP
jgi:hypothetical protein